MPFVDLFASAFRLPPRVCIVAPGPNGKGYYANIPANSFVIAVSKAVLIPEVHAQVWMMNHVEQDWYDEANRTFQGVRIFAYEAAMKAQASVGDTKECYYFVPPQDEPLEPEIRQPVAGVIRFGATVSACAVQVAYNFGAREILLCGVDMSGHDYFDGARNVHPHHGETWPAVQRLNPLLWWMAKEKGIGIRTLSPTKLDVPAYEP